MPQKNGTKKKQSTIGKVRRGTRRTFSQIPVLKAALSAAQQRFGHLPGVLGFGIGRQYHESQKKYGATPAHTGGLSIKVLVERKKKKPARSERIPRFIKVAWPGKKVPYKILIDIVTFAHSHKELRSRDRLQVGRGWPTAGSITPGRTFVFGKKEAEEYGTQFSTSNQVRVGTTGAVFKTKSGSHYAISAGHVFTEPCRGQTDCPTGIRAIGAMEKSFVQVEGDAFAPLSLVREGQTISDVMSFQVPNELLLNDLTWPDGFSQELAKPADINRALLEEGKITAFIWVERPGSERPQTIPVDLELQLSRFKDNVNCDGVLVPMEYGLTWGLLFTTDERTIGGDSGAGVFLISEDGFHSRLLGFHFLMSGGRSYAMDAETFFRGVFGNSASQVIFA